MKKLRLALAVAVVAFITVIAPSPAQAYPGVEVTVSSATVTGGQDIQITATVDPDVDCSWELTFMDQEVSGEGNAITHTFSTPEVDSVEEHEAVAVCFFDNGVPAAAGGGGRAALGASLGTVEVSSEGSAPQTLLPLDDGDGDDDSDSDDDSDDDGGSDGGDNGGLLPNTGGERLAWLIIGGMLVLVGGGVVLASRRRDA